MSETQKAKKVGEYLISLTAFAHGPYSEICMAKKVSNDDKLLVAKCIKTTALPKLPNIDQEMINKELYKNTKVTITIENQIKTKNNLYHIYNFYESTNLSNLLKTQKQNLTLERKLSIALMIAKGLRTLHENKLMHRNLDGFHVLLPKDLNEIKFCGLSSIYDFSKMYPTDTFGNPDLCAPEILLRSNKNIPYNEKVDIFSFGSLFYSLFKGTYFSNTMDYNSIDNLDEVPKEVKDLMKECLNIDPDKRPSAQQLIEHKAFSICSQTKEYIPAKQIPMPSHEAKKEELQIPTKNDFAPYEKTKKNFGEGAYAKVYEVINTITKEKFALKEIKMEKIKFSPKATELIYGEIKLLNELKELSFVTKLVEYFHFRSNLCMVLELCNGGSLDGYIRTARFKGYKLREDELKVIAWNIAEGLYNLHMKKIVHRDLKPDNILLIKGKEGSIIDAKICDLGLSRQMKDVNAEYQTVCGTRIYMAPEVMQRKKGIASPLTNKVDVFSFGLVLFFMIYGEDAYNLPENEPVAGDVILKPIQNISPEYMDLMKLCLEPDPLNRISFEHIIKHPFFDVNRIKLAPVENPPEFDQKDPIYKGKVNLGFIDSNEKYWISVFPGESTKNIIIKRQIYREIDFLQKSKAIPHSVIMVDYGLINEQIAIIFELCNGLSLQNIFIDRKSDSKSPIFDLDEIKCVAKNVIQFLDVMHGKNFLHRGLNLAHILAILDANEKIIDIKLCGFRTSKSENLDSTVSLVATEESQYFIDPLYSVQGLSEESDLWSLGIVIYYMAFEKPPTNVIFELKKIRETGKILFPMDFDANIKNFITYCFKPRKPGELSQIVLADDLLKNNIIL